MFTRLQKQVAVACALVAALMPSPSMASVFGEVQLSTSSKRTGRFNTGDFTTVASTSDFFVITAGSVPLRIVRIWVEWVSSAGVTNWTVYGIKRTTANTGGTSVADTIVSSDSADAAIGATAKHYTANPSALGSTTNGGTYVIRTIAPFYGTHGIYMLPQSLTFYDADPQARPITLRPGESFCMNGNGTTKPNTTTFFSVTAEVVEDN